MKKPLLTIKRRVLYSALPGLMLAAMFFLTGCEAPSGGAPGARPGMAPGAPGGGRPSAMKSGGAGGVKKPGIPGAGGIGKAPGAPGGPNVSPQNPLQTKAPETANAEKNPDDPNKAPGNPAGGMGVNPMAPTAKVEQAGNNVNLASEVIIAGANPFLNRLPKPIVVADPAVGETVSTAPPPADPFESVSLLGIAYHEKTPMALISVSGGETQTQMVRKGDVLMMDGGQVKVSKIDRESIEFEKLGTGNEKRTFSLPSIIGYGGSSAADKAGDGGGPAEGGKSPGAGRGGKPMGGSAKSGRGSQSEGSPDLPNLGKISAGRSGGQAPSGSDGSGGDVVLKEP